MAVAGRAVVALGNGQISRSTAWVYWVRSFVLDDKEIAPTRHEFLCRQAGRGHPEHHTKGRVRRQTPRPRSRSSLAAVRYQPHGLIPIFEVGHHGEHDPQGAVGRRPEQGADLRLKLMGLAQAVADAPQAQLGGLQRPDRRRPWRGRHQNRRCALSPHRPLRRQGRK